MKLQSILSAMLFAAIPSLTFAVDATDSDKVSTVAAPAAQAYGTKVKPHSHMQEKTGIAAPAPSPKDRADRPKKADKDKSKHYHPRDGK